MLWTESAVISQINNLARFYQIKCQRLWIVHKFCYHKMAYIYLGLQFEDKFVAFGR
jgi:hypothetical protein